MNLPTELGARIAVGNLAHFKLTVYGWYSEFKPYFFMNEKEMQNMVDKHGVEVVK